MIDNIEQDEDYDLLTPTKQRVYIRNKKKERNDKNALLQEKSERAKNMEPWLHDGRSASNRLQMRFNAMKTLVYPYQSKMRSFEELKEIFERVRKKVLNHDFLFLRMNGSQKILNMIRTNSPIFHKSKLIQRRFYLNRQICQNTDPECSSISEMKALDVLVESTKKFVFLSKASSLSWKLMQTNLSDSIANFEKIDERLVQCERVYECKNSYHYRQEGCPMCGAIQLGTSNALESFVKSIHLKTGVVTLIKLDLEVDLLTEALEVQEQKAKCEKSELLIFEEKMFMKILIAVQRWYCCYLARKRYRRAERNHCNSLFYYKIRRLVLVKHEIDCQDAFNIDKMMLFSRYSELRVEIDEYINVVIEKKMTFVEFMAKIFVQKLRTAVIKKRRKIALEEGIIADKIADKENKNQIYRKKVGMADLRQRVRMLENEKFICIPCNYRIFLSKQRYNIHISQHSSNEMDAQQLIEKDKLAKVKDAYYERIAASRLAITNLNLRKPCSLNDFLTQNNGNERKFREVNPSSDSKILPLLVKDNIVKSADLIQPIFYLQLVSKKEGYNVSDKTPLTQTVTRIGTDKCECLVTSNEITNNTADQSSLSMISPVHCIIYHNPNIKSQMKNEFNENELGGRIIRVVDNSSKYYTYVISKQGIKKVSRTLGEGVKVLPGDLICLGIGAIGILNKFNVVTTNDLSDACVVFRVSQY